MGWAVGWDFDHGRHRGYGVPAYCDAKGCSVEIDRGLGYVCECWRCYDEEDDLSVTTFVCGEHTCADVDWADVPEHPTWLEHVLTDDSWEQWRTENPARVLAYREALSEIPSSPGGLNGGAAE